VIVWLSLTPSPPKVDFEASDKVGHVLAYAALMFWFSQIHFSTSLRLIHAAIFLLMGVGLEVLQGMSGLRSYELLDMLANAAGVILGWLAARVLPPLLPRP
jgi:glycopeptide antibiotics resistance protein